MNINHSRGFTLVELLIAITLSSVIFLGVSQLMISLFVSNTRVRQIDRIAQTKNDIVMELTQSVRWATSIGFDTNALLITSQDNLSLRYTFVNNRIEKDGQPLTTADVLIQNFVARNVGGNPALPLVEVTFDIVDASFPTISSYVRFVVSQRVTSVKTDS